MQRHTPTTPPSFSRRSRSRSKTRQTTPTFGPASTRPGLVRSRSSQRSIKIGLSEAISYLDLNNKACETRSIGEVEIPWVKATLDNSLPVDYLKQDILSIVQALRIPKWWKMSDPGRIKLNRISGAMTNAIYKLEGSYLDSHGVLKSCPPLLLRVYGPNFESIIDRDYELQVLARLSLQNIGPKLYGCFDNGRFEQFLHGAITLTKDDIRDFKTSQRIARRMKELHAGVKLTREEIISGAACWKTIEKWCSLIEKAEFADSEEVFFVPWDDFKAKIASYKEWLYQQYPGDLRLTFCHNDAQYGNLLFTSPPEEVNKLTPFPSLSASTTSLPDALLVKTTSSLDLINPTPKETTQDKKLVVIDFEYAGANVPAYDLANHFSEWMADYHCDEPHKSFPEMFPNVEQMLNFLYSYVIKFNPHAESNTKEGLLKIDSQVSALYNEIIWWRAAVQLHWALWGVIQSGKLKVDTTEQEVIEGPAGEKYLIVNDVDSKDTPEECVEEPAVAEGTDIDTFEFYKYSSEKISMFWGDLIRFGLADESELKGKPRFLNTDLF